MLAVVLVMRTAFTPRSYPACWYLPLSGVWGMVGELDQPSSVSAFLD